MIPPNQIDVLIRSIFNVIIVIVILGMIYGMYKVSALGQPAPESTIQFHANRDPICFAPDIKKKKAAGFPISNRSVNILIDECAYKIESGTVTIYPGFVTPEP